MTKKQEILTEEKILENAIKHHRLSFNPLNHDDLIKLIHYTRRIGFIEGILEATNENDTGRFI